MRRRLLLAIMFVSVMLPFPSVADETDAPIIVQNGYLSKRIAGTDESAIYALVEQPMVENIWGAVPGHSLDLPQVLLHIEQTPKGPKIKQLVQDAISVWRSPPMGIDWEYYSMQRIVGVTTDNERLYVLLAAGRTETKPVGGPIPLRAFRSTGFRVVVFRMTDGEPVHQARLERVELPDEMPPPSIDPGPLKVADGSLSIYGHRFEFEADKLVRHVKPTK